MYVPFYPRVEGLCLWNAKHVLYVHMRRKLYDFVCNVKYATGDTKPILEDTWKGTQLTVPPLSITGIFNIQILGFVSRLSILLYIYLSVYFSKYSYIVCIWYISVAILWKPCPTTTQHPRHVIIRIPKIKTPHTQPPTINQFSVWWNSK